MSMQSIYPGVAKYTFGTPESATPVRLRNIDPDAKHADNLPPCNTMPFQLSDMAFKQTVRGCMLELPLDNNEDIYGFGLQLKSHVQTGKKKTIRVNSDPVADTGDSHAPVPFYLSTNGYGVLVDTARYVSFYCGSHQRRTDTASAQIGCHNENIGTSTEMLYAQKKKAHSSMMIDVPSARGIDIYIFGGPSMLNALQRYVMFSGGGCLPPLWGLGMLYRGYARNNQDDTIKLARYLRDNKIPCDVFGLEPAWMDKSYACNYLWNKGNFPDPDAFLDAMREMGYEINLWEQLFVHPSAPFYFDMKPYSGDFDVWEGLVPDFSFKEARDTFSRYHKTHFLDRGVHGFKVDECDNSDFIPFPWSFPESSAFPSGMDGEQMHSSLGRLGQQAVMEAFHGANKRTYGNCRSSHAMASPYPFVLYSDLYDHKDFIRGTVNAGLSGLLWTPEVRCCASTEDLIRRIQSAIFSPMVLINAWTLKNPPWLQFNETLNNQDTLLDNHKDIEGVCRRLFELRMSLIPYLYSAFAVYRFFGIPPFRALVVDYPEDSNARNIDDQYMMGESMMFAPLTAGENNREVYFPEGKWIDFFSNRRYTGGESYHLSADVDAMLLFVRNNTLLPIARPVERIHKEICFNITVKVYGATPAAFNLYHDDGYSFNYEKGDADWITLSWEAAKGGSFHAQKKSTTCTRYSIKQWDVVKFH